MPAPVGSLTNNIALTSDPVPFTEPPLNSGVPDAATATGPFSPDQTSSPYLVYNVKSRFIYDAGILGIPAATDAEGDEADMQFVKVCSATAYRIVTFELARIGLPCVPPDPTPNTGETLIKAEIEDTAPNPSADAGSLLWRRSGYYLFALTVPGLEQYAIEDTLSGVGVPTPQY